MAETKQHFQKEEKTDLLEEAKKYLPYWPWFLGSVIICLMAAFLHLRYTVPEYQSKASIIIKDEKGGGMSETEVLEGMGLIAGMGNNDIENEMEILRSRQLMKDVVRKLQLHVRYFKEGNIRTTEIYSGSPIDVHILQMNEDQAHGNFKVYEAGGGNIRIVNEATETEIRSSYGEPVDLGFGTIVVNKRYDRKSETNKDDNSNFPVIVKFTSVESVASSYRGRLGLNKQTTSLIELTLVDPLKEKARDVLDQLIYEYNRQAIADRNLVAKNTADFIEERLVIITEELDTVETGIKEFKESNQLTDIQSEAQMFTGNINELKMRQQELETQLELSKAMLEYINSDTSSDLLPSNLGISEGSVNSMISQYNQLVLQRNRILEGSTQRNPVVIDLNQQIEQMRGNVVRSLERMRANLLITMEELNQQAAVIGSEIAAVPGKEKQFRGIDRQQNVKEALYLFLLQKREETNLSLAVTAPKAKIVNSAYSSNAAVSPNRNRTMMMAFVIGLLIPFSIIFIRNYLDNKVNNQKDLRKAAKDIPIVGKIPSASKNDGELIKRNDRSVLAEAFRILHTNLQYVVLDGKSEGNGDVLFVSSTVKGEGKTFISFNLALTLAHAGNRVLLLGADLRNPQIQRYEKERSKKRKGISDYLVDKNLELESLIEGSDLHSNLNLLHSGTIPPNPSELWRHQRTAELFERIKTQYDYIVVDTAPAMLVTDTFLINKYADVTLFVVRAGYTETKLVDFAVEAKEDGKLHNVSFVLNDVKMTNFGYGRKYGYAYGQEEQGFWKKMRKRF